MNVNAMYQWIGETVTSSFDRTLYSFEDTMKKPSSFERMMRDKSVSRDHQPKEGESQVSDAPVNDKGGAEKEQEKLSGQYGLTAEFMALQGIVLPVMPEKASEMCQVLEEAPVAMTVTPATEQVSASVRTSPVVAESLAGSAAETPFDAVAEPVAQPEPKVVDAEVTMVQANDSEEDGGVEMDFSQKTDQKEAHKDYDVVDGGQGDEFLFRKADAVPVKVAEVQPEEISTETPEKQIQGPLLKALERGDSKVEISLTPENLGKVIVQITQSVDGSLLVRLSATTERATSLLESQSYGLQSLLAQNNPAPVRIEVQNQGEYQNPQQFLDADGGGQGQQRRQQENQKQEQSQDFMQQLRLGLVQLDQAAM